MSLETINLPHLPASLPIHVALYRDVQNASFLRHQLLSGNADFEYAFIDASMASHVSLDASYRSLTISIRYSPGPMLCRQYSEQSMTI